LTVPHRSAPHTVEELSPLIWDRSMEEPTKRWKPRRDSYLEGLEYMKGRMNGTITSLQTPWDSFNKIGAGGWEWQSTVILAGRSGNLKSTIKDNIIQQGFDLNKNEKFRVLNFSFEMIGRVTALREFSCAIARPYQYLCSADGQFNKTDLAKCYEYAKKKANTENFPVDVVDEPCTINEFVDIIEEYMLSFKTETGFTKTVISVDHSLLFVIAPFERDEHEMLRNLGNALTKLKKRYPIIFIVLSQLNRNVERPERMEDGKSGNYVTKSDIYGSDSLVNHADLILGVSRPATVNIRYYGTSRFIIQDDQDLIVHWLKVRNGSTGISFFRCDFDSMTIRESDPLPMANGAIKRMPAPIEEKKATPMQQNDLFMQQQNQ
jgi:replicative DNA helicase